MRRRLEELEAALVQAESEGTREGLLVALAKAVSAGSEALNWDVTARLLRAWYYSWHSEEVDEFGYDEKFTESIRPLFEFLYTVWWRVETTGILNVPADGPALLVANHSGVLPTTA